MTDEDKRNPDRNQIVIGRREVHGICVDYAHQDNLTLALPQWGPEATLDTVLWRHQSRLDALEANLRRLTERVSAAQAAEKN